MNTRVPPFNNNNNVSNNQPTIQRKEISLLRVQQNKGIRSGALIKTLRPQLIYKNSFLSLVLFLIKRTQSYQCQRGRT